MTTKKAEKQESWCVLRAQAGDTEALDQLLKGVQEPLFRYIQSLVREPQLAEDILQEVFLRIYRKLGWLREPELFRVWAYRIATNETFRHFKQQRPWSDQIRDEEVLSIIPALPDREAFAPELVAKLPLLIERLSPASRAVIVLYYLHELPLAEVAEALDIPVGTVKSRLAYGLSRLRQQLQL